MLACAQGYLISAMGKICAQEKFSPLPPSFESAVHKFSNSLNTNLQQRCYELITMLQMPQDTLEEVMPIDGSCEDIEVGSVERGRGRGRCPSCV